MKKVFIGFTGLIVLLITGYWMGPRPAFEEVNPTIVPIKMELDRLDVWIDQNESLVVDLKPENEARIIWADSIRKTDWSIVYLHGFSASPREGFPVHETIAKKYGMNLYLARIDGHGIDSPESFLNLTPKGMMESAKQALAIGQLIGEKVLLMSCSTGGTFSIYLAAHHPELVDAQVLYSPNIEIYDPNAKLLTGPWGMQLAKAILSDYRRIDQNIGNIKERYTTSIYRTEGVVALQALLDQTMKPTYFEKITQPTFIGYYYKNEEEQDQVVSVEAMRQFAQTIATSKHDIRQVSFADAGNHVICSDLHSNDYQGVIDETSAFIEEVIQRSVVSNETSSQLDR